MLLLELKNNKISLAIFATDAALVTLNLIARTLRIDTKKQ